MLQETADEHGSGNPDHPLSPGVVGAHAHQHIAIPDPDDALVGNGGAMGIAGQVVEHLGRTAKRGLGVDHPVVPQQAAAPLGPSLGSGRRIER